MAASQASGGASLKAPGARSYGVRGVRCYPVGQINHPGDSAVAIAFSCRLRARIPRITWTTLSVTRFRLTPG
jgi:hypothetical protein